ncbi:SpoIID/LytB domain-containing protein [Anaeromicropila populeti]|uniref:Stage II sporulation protein D n=1 Tax=Anaeromicropila populeti TaxID=37658 RepID=A0A1I6HRS9_9FIRM|nr:SpoIID/LytB domain-containing protein [Anaeromicropila populeti]SFR57068.1 stage II sporulation protein D [Anaeromicropila populeti]
MKKKRKVFFLLFSLLILTGIYARAVFTNLESTGPDEVTESPESPKEPEETVLYNAWILTGRDQEVKVFYKGSEYTYSATKMISKEIKETIGDVYLKDGKVEEIQLKPEVIEGRVLTTKSDYIEVETKEDTKKLPLSEQFVIYKMGKELTMENANAILVGYSNTRFIVAGGQVCAALIEGDVVAKNIRVLISTTDYEGPLHDSVTITSTSKFKIIMGEKEKTYAAKKKIVLDKDSPLLKEGRIKIMSSEENGKIKISSIKRADGAPSYRGILEVSVEEGKLVVVNELSLEEYLYSVIPSEMPASYGLEALKVQAVCARTYAYNQLMENRYGEYGAHVDDSVSSQVYNNIFESDVCTQAVKETYGQVMTYEGEIIATYYFSTSCGYTASAQEVWLNTVEVPYLQGTLQCEKEESDTESADLSNEETFHDFLENENLETYDAEFPWYRWKTTVSGKELTDAIDKNLQARYEVNPSLILKKDKSGKFVSAFIQSIGMLEEIEIANRTKSGLVNEVILQGSEATIKVLSEYNIRLLLAPLNSKITRKDNSIIDGMKMLPSAFFYVTKKSKNNSTNFTFYGGGYGHGVGMSQNGAKAMVEQGKSYEEVLAHYYHDMEMSNLYL